MPVTVPSLTALTDQTYDEITTLLMQVPLSDRLAARTLITSRAMRVEVNIMYKVSRHNMLMSIALHICRAQRSQAWHCMNMVVPKSVWAANDAAIDQATTNNPIVVCVMVC